MDTVPGQPQRFGGAQALEEGGDPAARVGPGGGRLQDDEGVVDGDVSAGGLAEVGGADVQGALGDVVAVGAGVAEQLAEYGAGADDGGGREPRGLLRLVDGADVGGGEYGQLPVADGGDRPKCAS